jgi:hypothetical protein
MQPGHGTAPATRGRPGTKLTGATATASYLNLETVLKNVADNADRPIGEFSLLRDIDDRA